MNRDTERLLSSHELEGMQAFVANVLERHRRQVFDIVLFGSKARGDADAESDIDILLVTESEDWPFKHAISHIASRVGLEYNVVIDPRIIRAERWERMGREGFSLYQNIAREGISLMPEPASS